MPKSFLGCFDLWLLFLLSQWIKNIQTTFGDFGLYKSIFCTINFIYLKCFHVIPTWEESKI